MVLWLGRGHKRLHQEDVMVVTWLARHGVARSSGLGRGDGGDGFNFGIEIGFQAVAWRGGNGLSVLWKKMGMLQCGEVTVEEGKREQITIFL